MSQFYILINRDPAIANFQKGLFYNLAMLNRMIKVEQAAIVTVPDELDCLVRSIDGVLIKQIPMNALDMEFISNKTIDEKALADQVAAAIPTPETIGKKPRRRPASQRCSQCGEFRPLTKTGICKVCAMGNARAARRNERTVTAGTVGSEERKINASTRIEPTIITQHGPIKGKKLA